MAAWVKGPPYRDVWPGGVRLDTSASRRHPHRAEGVQARCGRVNVCLRVVEV